MSPAASRLPNGSRQCERDPEARPRERGVGGDHARDADQAELLADDREDHVRVRLGEVEDLLDARGRGRRRRSRPSPCPIIAWTVWNPAPCASCHGLRKLKKRARRYGSMPDRGEAERERRSRCATSEHAQLRPGDEQDRDDHHHDRDRRAEVGLEDDQRGERRRRAARSGASSSFSVRGGLRRARYEATQTASASFASSDGWKPAGPSEIQRRAPFTPRADHEHGGAEPERGDERAPARGAAAGGSRSATRRSAARSRAPRRCPGASRYDIGSPFPSAAEAEVAL